mmetsp:Transcript_25727/g.31098  ORF Transcript_25727/g.31098 Transcript_25727/m.31098 type:complete len:88 (+) Transcript_25727:157-420(+)
MIAMNKKIQMIITLAVLAVCMLGHVQAIESENSYERVMTAHRFLMGNESHNATNNGTNTVTSGSESLWIGSNVAAVTLFMGLTGLLF